MINNTFCRTLQTGAGVQSNQYQRSQLDNDSIISNIKEVEYYGYTCPTARLILIPIENATIFSCSIYTNAGSLLEKDDELGVAHFLEHMTFKGTRKYPNKSLTAILDMLGSMYNAATSYESTDYELHGLPFHYKQLLDIMIDMYHNSILTNEDMATERNVIMEEYNMSLDSVGRRLFSGLLDLITKEKYKLYGRPIIGTEETILNLELEDLIRYKKKYYYKDPIMITVSGKFLIEDVLPHIEQLMKCTFTIDDRPLKKNDSNDKITPFRSNTNVKISDRYKFIKAKREQTIITVTFPSYKAHNSNLKYVAVLCDILTSGMSGRLYQIIRVINGLAYNVSVDYDALHEFGTFTILMSVQNKNIIKALQLLCDSLIQLVTEGIFEHELTKAKNQYMTKLMMMYQQPSSYFSLYTKPLYYGYEVKNAETTIKEIDKITVNDINKLIKNIINFKQMYIVMYGPSKIKNKEIKELILNAYNKLNK
jgi:predicted Zn-dependent peptidase